jgi:HTH-type transcriptional regulator / antitoxin HigA
VIVEVKPIRTAEDYDAAMARIEKLWDVPPDSPESDELEILLALTGAYETKHYHVESPDPLALLEYRMDQMGLSQEEIKRFMASRKKVPELLSRESGLSIEMIKCLQDIPFEAFTVEQP